MLIDENLSWKHHILHIAFKISTSIGIIARLRHFVPLNTLQHIYRSLIQPYLLYGITAWGRADKIHRNKILCLQKRALRLMFFGDYKAHAVPFFISSSLLPLDLLYFKSVAVLMYDVSNNTSPPPISNLFNRPFPSSLVPLFQSESKCETFLMKMGSACSFILMQIQVLFIRIVSHLDSLLNRGTRELGNGLLPTQY